MGRIIVAAFVAVFIAAIAAVIGVPVLAQEAPAAPPPGADGGAPPEAPAVPRKRTPMAQLDTDHDGRISRAEWLAGGRSERGFDRVDTDHDGYLSTDEVAAAKARMDAMRAARQRKDAAAPQ